MRKDSVYSWRMTMDLRSRLEDVARRRKRPLAALLDEAVTHWLQQQSLDSEDEESRVRSAALRTFGKLAGGDPLRSSQAHERLRSKLRAKVQ